jgi:hypothetical protein
MVDVLSFEILASDRASGPIAKVGKSSAETAALIEAAQIKVEQATKRVTAAQAQAAQSAGRIQAAQIRVEKAALAAAAAEGKFGKESLQAREAASKLVLAQQQLSAAQERAGAAALRVRDANSKLTQAQIAQGKAMRSSTVETERAAKGLERFRGLGALAGTVVAGSLAQMARQSVATASDINESTSKVGVVFGQSSRAVLEFGETSARALGISKASALEAAGTFGNLFVALKLPQAEASKMSVRMVQLAADLASFNNATPEEALEALRSGLVGETEPLRKFGVNLNDATLRQKALEMGLISTTKETLPPAIKAQASYALILEQTKVAQGDFARTSDGLANQQRILQARTSDLAGAIGSQLLPAINGTLGALLSMADFIGENSDVIKPLIIGMAGLATGIIAVRVAAKAGDFLSGFVASVREAGSVTTMARGRLASMAAMLGGPWGIAIGAGVTALGLFFAKQREAQGRVDALTDALDQQTGALTGSAEEMIYKNLVDSKAIGFAKLLGLSLEDVTNAAAGNEAALERVNAVLDGMIAKTGGATEEQLGQAAVAQKLKGILGDQTSELAKSRQALKDKAAAGVGAAGAEQKLGTETDKTTEAMEDQRSAADKLRDALDRLNGKTIAADKAQISYRESVTDLAETLKENGKSFDFNTEAGRRNRGALIDAAQAAADYVVALRDQGASSDAVKKAERDARAELIKTMRQAGLSEAAAKRLADAYFSIPESRETKLKGDIADLQAKIDAAKTKLKDPKLTNPQRTKLRADLAAWEAAIRKAKQQLKSIKDETVVVSIVTRGDIADKRNASGRGITKATGGPVYGPGTGTSDSIPAMLSNGEHVWTAAEVKAAGGQSAVAMMRKTVLSGGSKAAGAGVRSAGSRPASSGAGPVVIQFVSDGSAASEAILAVVRKSIRIQGGNVQTVLGP